MPWILVCQQDSLNEMDKFIKAQKLSKLTQEIETLSRLIITKETGSVICNQNLPTKKIQA